MKLKDLLDKASKAELAERQEHAASKKGVLRAGNSGALMENGDVVGECHRKTLARTMGLEAETIPGASTQGFFALGMAHELWVADRIKNVLPEGHVMLQEEECPTEWFTSGKIKIPVTGRPDIVICEEVKSLDTSKSGFHEIITAKPVFGIELKALAADNSAAGVLLQGPKTAHLLQSMHYMLKLSLTSYSLFYSFFGSVPMPWWAKKQHGLDNKAKLEPFRKEYHLEINAKGFLTFADEEGSVQETVLTEETLTNFYELVADMMDKRTLFRRPSDKDHFGKMLPYSGCNYCKHKEACDSYEDNFDRWCDELAKNKMIAESE